MSRQMVNVDLVRQLIIQRRIETIGYQVNKIYFTTQNRTNARSGCSCLSLNVVSIELFGSQIDIKMEIIEYLTVTNNVLLNQQKDE